MNPFELTKQLMSIGSVTGTEGEVGEFLSSHLGSLGYRVDRQNVTADRFNVLAFAGDARVVMCTHIDTVPPTLPVREDNEFLYGRGACDTKGIIAAMLEAGGRLRRDGITNFGYLFVVGEETDSAGAKAANTLQWDCHYAVVGEPTQNQLARAQKGSVMVNFSVAGRAAHSGYPELGVSAVENLWKVLEDCRDADWGNDPVLGKGTLNIGVFQGGERANIVPARASASVMIRTIEPRSQAEEKLRGIVANRATMEVVSASDPQIMHVVDGFPTTVVSFGSDVPHLGNMGKRLLIGPGSILDAHTPDEKIKKTELMEGVDLYERLVRKLLL
ncbi:MAG TPA: M20/M25/M40 family metallo-hydrolase [Terriglobia bacterium]|nr:M20/M25/M40 family metallo-hydrolase [Terriglobia bacterium]